MLQQNSNRTPSLSVEGDAVRACWAQVKEADQQDAAITGLKGLHHSLLGSGHEGQLFHPLLHAQTIPTSPRQKSNTCDCKKGDEVAFMS
jgi:hypothetical protein